MLVEFNKIRCPFRPWKPALGPVFTSAFVLDVETTAIVGHEVPEFVLAAACDGADGVFLTPDRVGDFLRTHWTTEIVLHNCDFDLAVLDRLLRSRGEALDVYNLVDRQLVWDTMIMHRLLGVATVGHTYQGKGQSKLERCSQLYLGIDLPKDVRDKNGNDVRTSWGRWRGRPPNEIPDIYLHYLALDVLATFSCFRVLHPALRDAVRGSQDAFGYIDPAWLDRMTAKYGPQTHHLQVKAAVALGSIERAGFGLDLANRDEIVARVQRLLDELKESLRPFGYLAGEKGCDTALQAIIRRTLSEHRGLDVPRTPTGKYSTTAEDLEPLAEVSEFFGLYQEHNQVRALLNNYLKKMDATRLHSHYDLLKVTGRTSASAPNIQNIPKRRKRKKPGKRDAFDLRRCFAPAEGKLFYVADYSSVELRTLAQALQTQFRAKSAMAAAINQGVDLHRLLAARLKATGGPGAGGFPADADRLERLMRFVTDEERNAAKPANFGLPAGMGVATLKAYARVQYEQPYTDADAAGWKAAWLASFPEMRAFLQDDVDTARALAVELNLTPREYAAAAGRKRFTTGNEDDLPTGWLGGMALKVLKDLSPTTRAGREYSAAELDFFWGHLQPLALRLDRCLRDDLTGRRPSHALGFAIKRLVNRGGVFTITGRLRAKATFSARRNTVFQGSAADGAKLALYRLWRAGFKVVAFIHDEVVIELDMSVACLSVKKQIDDVLIGAMREICPDVRIDVEGAFRRRWGKDKEDEIAPVDDLSGDATSVNPPMAPLTGVAAYQ